MRVRPLLRVLSLICCLGFGLGAAPEAEARPWNAITAGASKRDQVIQHFGEPSKVIEVRDHEILAYFGTRAPQNTTQAQFRVNRKSGLVERIDIYPRAVLSRKLIETTYGGACEGGATADCYQEKLVNGSRLYLLYEESGLAVFLGPSGKQVVNFVHLPGKAPPAPERRPLATETSTENAPSAPPPEDASASRIDDWGSVQEVTSAIEDPLKIGGEIQMRGEVGVGQLAAEPVGAEVLGRSVLDLYFDARPNENVRGMVVGRLAYEPTLLQFPGAVPVDPASFNLDQLWLKFDLGYRLFVTLGKQHVKWGTGRFWSPVDFLTPTRRNVLDSFDERLGTDMLKVHLPWEETNANFYLIGLLNTQALASGIQALGGAARAEVVLFGAELAGSVVVGRNRAPLFGLDLSSPLGPLDLFAEVALRSQSDVPLWRDRAEAAPGDPSYLRFELRPDAYYTQASAGLSYEHNWSESVNLGVGAEAFYNQAGQQSSHMLPWLMQTGSYQPFYLGQAYGAVFASLYSTSVEDAASVSVAVLGNLSDRSFFSRVDGRFQLLKDLTLEGFVGVPFGRAGGELRFAADEPGVVLPDSTSLLPVRRPLPYLSVGFGLRVRI